jgi:hypothetical protein
MYCPSLNNSYSLLDHYPVALLKAAYVRSDLYRDAIFSPMFFSWFFFLIVENFIQRSTSDCTSSKFLSWRHAVYKKKKSFVASKQHAYNLTKDQSKKPGVSTKLSNSVETPRAAPKPIIMDYTRQTCRSGAQASADNFLVSGAGTTLRRSLQRGTPERHAKSERLAHTYKRGY